MLRAPLKRGRAFYQDRPMRAPSVDSVGGHLMKHVLRSVMTVLAAVALSVPTGTVPSAEAAGTCGVSVKSVASVLSDGSLGFAQGDRVDVYFFDLTTNLCKDIAVSATYDFNSKATWERLYHVPDGITVEANWTCSDDPYIYVSQPPSCTVTPSSVRVPPILTTFIPGGGNFSRPGSSQEMSDAGRAALRAAVEAESAKNNLPFPPGPSTAAADPGSVTGQVMARGASGQNVEAIQYLLRFHGEDVAVDGDFGDQTEAAVRAYQEKSMIPVDGKVGPRTWAALWVTVQNGSDGDAVRAVQTLLTWHNHPVDVDGDFGDQTAAAVADFQQSVGLAKTGVVDQQTWVKLVNSP
jgi:peptidoglycan hydrolase-like protein with peptidoglycan-binding domain